MKSINRIINYLAEKPKDLFLIDSIGAMLTAIFLFIIWRYFQLYFGMPKIILISLSAIAACLWIYSAICYFLLETNWSPFIKIISTANMFYCLLTLCLLIIHLYKITTIGFAYFFLEVIIVSGLIYIELKVVAAIKESDINATGKEIF